MNRVNPLATELDSVDSCCRDDRCFEPLAAYAVCHSDSFEHDGCSFFVVADPGLGSEHDSAFDLADVDGGCEIEVGFAYKEDIVADVVAGDAFGDQIVAVGKVGDLAVSKADDFVVVAVVFDAVVDADEGDAVVAGNCYCF